MGDALIRLTGGPDPETVASLVSEETAQKMEEAIENLRGRDRDTRRRLQEAFQGEDGGE